MQNKTHQAVIFANKPPNEKQKAGFMAFLTKEYGPDVTLEWQKETYPRGSGWWWTERIFTTGAWADASGR